MQRSGRSRFGFSSTGFPPARRIADFIEKTGQNRAFYSSVRVGNGFALLFFDAAILPLVRLQKSVINLSHDAAKGRDMMPHETNDRLDGAIVFSTRQACAATGVCRLD